MTERPNKELALRYYSDDTLKAWWWYEDANRWTEENPPDFDPDYVWRVGHEAPTQPPVRMCELAGVKFPMPMREAPQIGAVCWIFDLECPEDPVHTKWDDADRDRAYLANGLYQATREGAIQQGRAIAATIKQAIEGAK